MAKSGERDLWLSVVLRTLLDLRAVSLDSGVNTHPGLVQDSAQRWFESNECCVGSFKWICNHCNLDPGVIRSGVFALSRADLLHRLNKLAQENQARKVSASF